jgi:Pilin accessory protein (PilO)
MKLWRRLLGQKWTRKNERTTQNQPVQDLQGGVDETPEAEEKLEPRQCSQALIEANIPLVFGVRWLPITSEKRQGSLLEGGRQEGFKYYVTNSYQETVGLVGSLTTGVIKPHSAALVLSQHFAQGGTELFIFQQGEIYGLVGLVDYSPIPGFDEAGTFEEIQRLAEEFIALNSSQLVRYYGNVNWYEEAHALELGKLALKVDVSSARLIQIPNLKLRIALSAFALLAMGLIYAGYDYYQGILVEQEMAEQAFLNDPNRLYEKSLEDSIKSTGVPGTVRLQLWRNFFKKMPLAVNGWSAKTVTCIASRCDVVWGRESGNFQDFELGMPQDVYAQKNFKTDKGLVHTEISTSHDLANFEKPKDIGQNINLANLMKEVEAKKLWGSTLQDLSLLKNSTVTMDAMTLFGVSTATVDDLNKPVVKGAWSIDHEMWSLTDLVIPDFVVPELLVIKLDLKNGLRYKLEGSYYAKGK